MAPGSCAYWSPRVNPPLDPAEEQDELAGAQGPVRRSNVESNEAPTKAPIPPKAPTPPLVPLSAKDLFTKFIKVFIKTTQAQALAEPQERHQRLEPWRSIGINLKWNAITSVSSVRTILKPLTPLG